MNNERVLLVIDAMYIGGTETHVLGLAKELLKNNVFVAIAARKAGTLASSFESLNCPIYHIDFPRTLDLEETLEKQLVGKIEDIIEAEKVSLVHFHQSPSGYLAGKAAKNKGIQAVLTVHGTYYPDHEIRKLLDLSDSVICVSPPLCAYIKSFGVQNTNLVPNGINLEEYSRESSYEELRNELKIPKDSLVVLYASRITWSKASVCSTFLRACKDLKLNPIPNLHAIVVGDGDRLGDIKNLALMIEKQCKGPFIHTVGEQHNMHAYYSIANCVVGTGRVALEAMASEKPVIAVGNHGYFGIVNQDNIDEAWNHYFGDHGSKTACSRHILRDELKKQLQDRELLKLNGIESRKIVEEKFNIQSIVPAIMKIYSETVKGGSED
ncbi:glycosyltransferase [Ureibacillus aquaedulcis]|uniref:Glycosyltransferase n=1 Tax=Ureibacillus aquaedulcis TaxID=3058421 RepID=A0ABT8GP36_9BACL|nr:glycosyltransferase [Ureibacillus sp. BA0131]MDN4493190.1 glycosyltransferase [Ureibacillus sp. BA0131]